MLPGVIHSLKTKLNSPVEVFWEEAERVHGHIEAPVYWSDAEHPLFILYTS